MGYGDYVQRGGGPGKVLSLGAGLPAPPSGRALPPFDARTPPPLPRFQSDFTVEEIALYAKRHSDYFYVFDFPLTVATGLTDRNTKRIHNDMWFALMSWSIASTGAFTMQLADTSKGMYYNDEPMPSVCIAGTAVDPYYLPNVIMFDPGNMLTVMVADTTGVDNAIQIVLAGRRYRI